MERPNRIAHASVARPQRRTGVEARGDRRGARWWWWPCPAVTRRFVIEAPAQIVGRGIGRRARAATRWRGVPRGTSESVAQQVVSGVDARHTPRQLRGGLSVAGGSIRMMLARQLTPATLDLSVGSGVADIKDAVRIAPKALITHNGRGYHASHAGRTKRAYSRPMRLPFEPPIEPMLAKLAADIPTGDGWLFEPKWDGFRAIVFRDGDEVYIQSRDLKPLERYFPELPPVLRDNLPERCVVDGEIVIPGAHGLDFDSLLLRIHPAASRVKMLAEQTPAAFVAWDLLALGDDDLRTTPQGERRKIIERELRKAKAPVHLTPATNDAKLARDWFERFEGAGLDGVVAKALDAAYQPGKRAMLKIKHARTADCAVAGFRWHKNGPATHVGSLLLGLFDNDGRLHHVGITSSFSWDRRAELAQELAPLREGALDGHPWMEWAQWAAAGAADASGTRMPGATSRWNRGKDLSWEPLRVERVAEVRYDHLQGDRFRHATTFSRWRLDKQPADCRYDQLEENAPYELAAIFRGQ